MPTSFMYVYIIYVCLHHLCLHNICLHHLCLHHLCLHHLCLYHLFLHNLCLYHLCLHHLCWGENKKLFSVKYERGNASGFAFQDLGLKYRIPSAEIWNISHIYPNILGAFLSILNITRKIMIFDILIFIVQGWAVTDKENPGVFSKMQVICRVYD